MIALAFDEILGITNIAGGHPGMTARLTVHYRKPTPLFRELRWTGTVDRVEGRRIMSSARLYDGDVLTAEADGIFLQPRPELAAEYFPDVPVMRELGEHETLLSIEKARNLLGYEPVHSWRDQVTG